MDIPSTFIFSVIAVFFTLCLGQPPQQAQAAVEKMDHYLFALQWPISYCASQDANGGAPCIIPPYKYFTVHGVWPVFANGSSMTLCDGEDLILGNLDHALQDKLHRYWPSFTGPDFTFWNYEWIMHGKCSGLTPPDYFQLAVDSWDEIGNVSQQLMKGYYGIKARPKSYTYDDIYNAFQGSSKLNFMPAIKCTPRPDSGSNLWELHFNISLPNIVTDYDKNAKLSNCFAPIYYPLLLKGSCAGNMVKTWTARMMTKLLFLVVVHVLYLYV